VFETTCLHQTNPDWHVFPRFSCETPTLVVGGSSGNAEELGALCLLGGFVKKSTVVLVLLFAAWLVWSGGYSIPGADHFHGLVLALGLASCVIVLALHARMERQHSDRTSYLRVLGFITYGPWLFWQIVLSNLQIARVVLSPKLPIHPQLVRIRANLRTDFGWTVLANSITLTPGTLTLDVRNGFALIHALTDETAADIRSGTFPDKVAQLEGSPRTEAEGPTA